MFCPALSRQSGSGIRGRLIAEGLHHHGTDVCVVSSDVPASFSAVGIKSCLLQKEKSWEETLVEAARSFAPDILYGITEAGADAVMQVANRNNIPFVYDLHGIGIVEILELGSGYGSRVMRIKNSLKWLSKVTKATAVTIANPTLLPIIKKLNRKAVPIFGMTDVIHFSPEGPVANLGNDKSKNQILFAGNYFKWQGINLLIDAIKILIKEQEPFEFTFLGTIGKNTNLLNTWKNTFPEDKVHFYDEVDYREVANYYRAADCLIIPRPFMLSTYLAFPQKLVDYMAAGRTIVATDITPHRWALESPPAGILCKPTGQSLADAIRKTKDLKFMGELSVNARKKAVEEFCHLRQSLRIYKLFNDILYGKKT